MKKFRITNKIIFAVNVVFALVLLVSYGLPFFFLKGIPSLAILSLFVPVFIIVNILFLLFWSFKRKKYALLSLLVLLIGYQHVLSLYKFNNGKDSNNSGISFLSYNVRLFNAYEWIKNDSVAEKIGDLIKEADPDVLCLQEFYYDKEDMFNHYPHNYINYKSKNKKTGQAIFSKYPIIEQGSLEFPYTSNNAIYADIRKGGDTIRVYNLHMESFHIIPDKENIMNKKGDLIERMGTSFKSQQEQVAIFNSHQKQSHHKKVICGDFNNTQYSSVYRRIKGDMKDTFNEAGHGFGRTFDFKYFPVRIDFILVDKEIEVTSHKNYSEKLSDHFPIQATLIP